MKVQKAAKLLAIGEHPLSSEVQHAIHTKVLAAVREYEGKPSYTVQPVPNAVYVAQCIDRPLSASGVRFAGHDAVVNLGVADRKRKAKGILWVLAHELAHCYLGPVQDNTTKNIMLVYPHDELPWERVADDIASQVVDFDRRRWNRSRGW